MTGQRKPLNAARIHRVSVAPMGVYDGQNRLGEIEDHGRAGVLAFVDVGAKRLQLGIFADRRSAMRAVSDATNGRPRGGAPHG